MVSGILADYPERPLHSTLTWRFYAEANHAIQVEEKKNTQKLQPASSKLNKILFSFVLRRNIQLGKV